MESSAGQTGEWVDGFLFVGNQLALDFLNTRIVNAEGPVELLPDTASLGRWLVASGILATAEQKLAAANWQHSTAAQHFLQELRTFRESLRSAVLRFQDGKKMEAAFLQELNQKLRDYPQRYVLLSGRNPNELRPYLEGSSPSELWRVFADSAAHLFSDLPVKRVRKCERCVVNFYDTSKKGSRRWCSMQICGNREKVANYRQKQRPSPGGK